LTLQENDIPPTDLSQDVGINHLPIWRKTDWFVCGFLLIFAVFTSALHNQAYPTLSPVDELQHIDYAMRASHLDFPRVGERVEQEAMAEAACRSVDAPGYVSQPCGLDIYNPGDFQEAGYNTSASQLPLYFLASGTLARVIRFTTPIDSMVSALRITGGVWLGLAFGVLWYVMAMLHLRRKVRAIAILLISSTPLIVFFSSTTTPDASLYLVGSLLLLAFLKYEAGRLRWWWLALVLPLAFTIDRAVFLPILVGVIFILMRILGAAKIDWQKLVFALGIPVLIYFTYFKIFPFLQNHLQPRFGSTDEVPMTYEHATSGVDINKLLQQIESVASPVKVVYLPYTLNTALVRLSMTLLNWMINGSLVGSVFFKKVGSRLSILAGGTLISMILAGPFYTFYYAYFSDADFNAPGRFGMALMPFATVAIASVLEKRVVMVVIGTLAVLSYSYLLWLLL